MYRQLVSSSSYRVSGYVDTHVASVGSRGGGGGSGGGLFAETARRGERAEAGHARLVLGEHGVLYAVHELVLERHPLGTIVRLVVVVGLLSQQIVRVDVTLEDGPTGRRRGDARPAATGVVVIGRRRPRRAAPVPFAVQFAGLRGARRLRRRRRRRARHAVLSDAVVRVLGRRRRRLRRGRRCAGRHGGRGRAEVFAAEERAARLVPAGTAAAAVADGPVASDVALVKPTVRVPHGLGQRAAGRHAVVLGGHGAVVRPTPVVVVTVPVRAVAVGRHGGLRRHGHPRGPRHRLLVTF